MKLFDVNIRTVHGLRAIGGGFSSLQKFCGYLNMAKQLTQKNFDRLSRQIMMATKNVAEKSMSDAALELRETENTDVGVSIDGTWQKRGFSSHNGVVTAISIDTGKVLDCEIMCRCCKGCTKMQSFRKTNPNHFEIWRASHKCSLNYQGSAPNMEKIGAVKIFECSIEKYSLRYTDFYGDGDSQSFSAVEKVYGDDKLVSKKECIGHYQRRVGNRLRKLRKEKRLGGKNRLTNTKIDTLQNYFGIALRQNIGNLEAMTNAIMASLFHVSGYHANCPKTSDSWCLYQRDKANGTNIYKPKGALPVDVRSAILPIYNDLTKPEMLIKCLHGKTQNANECFNGMIWQRIPKIYYVGLQKLQFGVYDAIANFNYGKRHVLIFWNSEI